MLKRFAVAAAMAALAFGPARAESQDKPDSLQLDLTAKTPSFKVRRPNLVLNGACSLSDGVIVKVCWCVRIRVFLSQGQETLTEMPFSFGNVPAGQIEQPIAE